jgi:D-serine deaminase-like pyridoxal phosphate-dependent protein
VRVCLDIDAGWWVLGGRIRVGVKRSPVRTPEQASALAADAAARAGIELVGLMAYEAHIAGIGDAPPGRRVYGAAVRAMQRASARELAARRAAVVAAVREVQTPVLGPGARDLALGDRVWFRHAKAGELCERFASLHLVRGEELVDEVPTYRGEGQTFL